MINNKNSIQFLQHFAKRCLMITLSLNCKSQHAKIVTFWIALEALKGCQNIFGHTAVSRKVVGKSASDNPESYCGWFCLPCSPKKFERIAGEAMDICWQVLMESNKSRFNSYSRSEQCIDHIPYYLSGLSCAHFFRQPFSK